MSLYGSLFSGVTGLAAQSRSLGTISENITNVNTVGFKAKTSHFATLVAAGSAESGSVGGVRHTTSNNVDVQGIVQSTNSETDIAIAGGGFFVVNNDVENGIATGDTLFTRAGHFAIDQDRHLANASGNFLMGWQLNRDGDFVDSDNNVITPDPTSEADLQPVDLSQVTFTSEGTSTINMAASFPAGMTVGDTFNASSRVFDALGGTHNLGFGFTKADHIEVTGTVRSTPGESFQIGPLATEAARENGPTTDNTSITLDFAFDAFDAGSGSTTWTVDVTGANVDTITPNSFTIEFDSDGALTDTSMREINVVWDGSLGAKDSIMALDFDQITFDAAAAPAGAGTVNANSAVLKLDASSAAEDDVFVSGASTFIEFVNGQPTPDTNTLTMEIDWDNGETFADNSTINFDLSDLAVTGNDFQLISTNQDGVAFGAFTGVSIDRDGFVIANFKNGTFLPVYRLPLADFNNPNGLQEVDGNAYESTLESGSFFLNQPGVGGAGTIVPRALEQSTVDIAREFSNMIITQRAFSSASTVITTSDEMLQELVQIKR